MTKTVTWTMTKVAVLLLNVVRSRRTNCVPAMIAQIAGIACVSVVCLALLCFVRMVLSCLVGIAGV